MRVLLRKTEKNKASSKPRKKKTEEGEGTGAEGAEEKDDGEEGEEKVCSVSLSLSSYLSQESMEIM